MLISCFCIVDLASCVHKHVYVYLHWRVSNRPYLWMCEYGHAYVCIYQNVKSVCMYVCVYMSMRVYVCLWVCMYVCMYVHECSPVCVYVCMHIGLIDS